MKNQMTISKAIKIIKAVPYEDNLIDFWVSEERHITQWIQSAEAMNKTLAIDKLRGINTEEVVEAYEAGYREIARQQGVSFQHLYMPIFFLAIADIKNRFIANQFLRNMTVISHNC